jgi:PAS domain S-box-containing protein
MDDDGNVIGIVGTSRDITDHVRTLHALQETEFFLNRSQQVGRIGSYKFDVRSGFWESSSSLDEILGVDESCRKNVDGWLNLVAPEDRAMMRDHMMHHVLRDRQRFEKEYRIVRRTDGQMRWVFGLGELEIDDTGKPTRMIGTIQDITERRRIEDKLRVSEERLQQAIRVSNIGIFDHDQIADIIYWSPDIRRSYDIGMDEAFTLSDFLKRLHPDDLQEIGQAVQRAHDPAGNGVFDVEYRFIRRDGEIRWFAAKSQTFFSGEGTSQRPVRTIGALIVITERKRIEEERETLIEKLEAKNAELERFTYTVSHDLKSPLVTIKGFLGFIERDATSGNMERLKGDLRRISDAVEKMRLLLGDLLELSRVGRFSRPSETVPFEELVNEAIGLVEGSIREHNVTVKLQPGLPAVYGDRQRLVEVLQNLLDNATKFMGNQSDPCIEIGQSGEESCNPVFYVRDNGIGFAPEFHEHIFGLFNKLDPKSEGTGVGLALVKRIVEVHGGRVWVESEMGKGATFYFTLPGAPETCEAKEAEKKLKV